MNYSSNFDYYNLNERKQYEYVKNIIMSSSLTEYKNEKRDFFKTHRYILNLLSRREALVFSLYFGLDTDEMCQQNEIAEIYGVTRERIRQILLRMFAKLNHHIIISMLSLIDDTYVESKGFKADDFTKDNIFDTCKKLLKQYTDDIYDTLSDDEKRADLLLNKILSSSPVQLHLLEPEKNDLSAIVSVGDLLKLSRKDLAKFNDDGIIDKVHALGLRFFWEFEYEQHWVNICRQGIFNVGLKNFNKFFGIDENNANFNKLIKCSIKQLNLSVRAYNAMTKIGVKTIEEMILMTEEDYFKIVNLGKNTVNDIHKSLNIFGMDMRPLHISKDEWLSILSKNNYPNIDENCSVVSRINTTNEVIEEHIVMNDFQKLLDSSINLLDLKTRARQCLRRNGINTIRDIVLLNEQQLIKINGFGKGCLSEVDNALRVFNLGLCPYDMEHNEWLEMLAKRHVVDSCDSISKANLVEENPQHTSKFYKFINTPINKIYFSYNTADVLRMKGFETIKDIVSETRFSLWSKLRQGDNTLEILQEIEEKIDSNGLCLKPQDYVGNDWLDTLQYINENNKDNNQSTQDDTKQRLITKLIEKYDNNEVISSIKLMQYYSQKYMNKRLLNQAVVNNLRSKSKPTCQLPKEYQINDNHKFNEYCILNSIKYNVENILSLEEDFIIDNSDKLIKIIYNSTNINIVQKLELIDFVKNIQRYSNSY